jgi:hypothetical protein
VSDIVAELFVIALTVVLAATLYVLVSGLTRTGASSPYMLGMGSPQESPQSASYSYGVIAISPQNGLTTALAGLYLANGSGARAVPVGTAPSSTCHFSAGFNNATDPCTAPVSGIWYAVLVNASSGRVADVWSLQSGTTAQWAGPTVALTQDQEIVVVWSSSYGIAGSADSLTAYSLASSSVSGQSGSF